MRRRRQEDFSPPLPSIRPSPALCLRLCSSVDESRLPAGGGQAGGRTHVCMRDLNSAVVETRRRRQIMTALALSACRRLSAIKGRHTLRAFDPLSANCQPNGRINSPLEDTKTLSYVTALLPKLLGSSSFDIERIMPFFLTLITLHLCGKSLWSP